MLIANGIEGIMIPAIASYTAIGHLQDAKLVRYSGGGHGFLFQHAKDFATEVTNFLNTWQNGFDMYFFVTATMKAPGAVVVGRGGGLRRSGHPVSNSWTIPAVGAEPCVASDPILSSLVTY